MNEREFERLLASVVDDGPVSVDDRVIDLALAEIPTTRQRGARVAFLERFAMKFHVVPLLGAAAAVALLIGSLALFNAPGFGSGAPTAPPGSEIYTSKQFRVPLRLTIPTDFFEGPADPALVAGGVVPWTKDDRPSMLSIIAPDPVPDRLTIIPRSEARVVGDAGEEPWPSDLAAWIAAQSGLAADEDALGSITIAGRARDALWVDLDPAGRPAGNLLIETADGEAVPLPDTPSPLFVIEVADGLAEPVVVIVSSGGEPPADWTGDSGNWHTALLRMAGSIESS